MNKFTMLSKAEMKKIVGAESIKSSLACVELTNLCSLIFEDECCQYEGQPAVICKGASGTQHGFCAFVD